MNAEHLLTHFDRLADAPDAIPRLRRFILGLAVRGKLVEQDPNDEPASELLKRIAAEKKRLVEAGEIKKEKPLPEIALDEIPFSAPPGWEWVRLASSTITVQGFAFSSESFSADPDAGYPLIKIGDIGTSAPEVFIKGPYDPTYLVNRGDILLGLSGSIKCAIWEGPTALLNQRIARIAPVSSDLLSVWLLFSVNACIDKWKDETSKLTVQNVKARQLYEALIPLPPLAEQHRIVAKVDELMALCDRLETARKEREATRDRLATASLARLNAPDPDPAVFQNHAAFALNNLTPLTTRPDQIKALRQTILNLAVRGKLVEQNPEDEPAGELLKRVAAEKDQLVKKGESKKSKPLPLVNTANVPFNLPAGWTWARFPEVGMFGRGKSKHRPRNDPVLYEDGKYPFIQTGDVARSGGSIETYSSLYNDVGLAQSAMWPAGTLCITIAANIADSGILTFDACFPDSVVGLIVHDSFEDARFFEYFLRTAKNDLREFAPSTAQKNINLGILMEVLIPLPPLAEYRRIVAKVDELMAVCDRLEESLARGEETRGRLVEAVLGGALHC